MCSFSALTLLVGSFDPYKPVPDMTYNVFAGTLNLTQPINLWADVVWEYQSMSMSRQIYLVHKRETSNVLYALV